MSITSLIDWQQIDTVLLDMDGTLLDLHFDDYFWLQHLPELWAKKHNLPITQAKQFITDECNKVSGTLAWYCLDVWAEKLNIDIMAAKRDIQHLIAIRPDAIEFIEAVKKAGKSVTLVTNAHPDSLSLKLERTVLGDHIDELISTHEFGVTKESQSLWQQLQARLDFDPSRTLFVDDSLPILRAAQEYGIHYLLAVTNPSSQKPIKDSEEFLGCNDLRQWAPD